MALSEDALLQAVHQWAVDKGYLGSGKQCDRGQCDAVLQGLSSGSRGSLMHALDSKFSEIPFGKISAGDLLSMDTLITAAKAATCGTGVLERSEH